MFSWWQWFRDSRNHLLGFALDLLSEGLRGDQVEDPACPKDQPYGPFEILWQDSHQTSFEDNPFGSREATQIGWALTRFSWFLVCLWLSDYVGANHVFDFELPFGRHFDMTLMT